MRKRRRRRVWPLVDYLDDRCLLSGTAGYTPAQITAAYGLNAITFQSGGKTVAGDGAGETIALIEMYHDPNLTSDLATFDQKYGLAAPPNLTVDNLGGSQTNSDWASRNRWMSSGPTRIRPARTSWWSRRRRPERDATDPEPDDRREHGERDAGRDGRLDELGRQRVPRRDRL